MTNLFYRLRLWRWGPLTEHVTDSMDAWGAPTVTEYEVRTAKGKLVGYWAYGNFDPSLPYRGIPVSNKNPFGDIEF